MFTESTVLRSIFMPLSRQCMVAIVGKVAVINKRRAGDCTTGTIGIRMSHRSLPLFIPRHCDRAVSGICHPSRVATGPTRLLTSRKLELHPPIEHRQPACVGGGEGVSHEAIRMHWQQGGGPRWRPVNYLEAALRPIPQFILSPMEVPTPSSTSKLRGVDEA